MLRVAVQKRLATIDLDMRFELADDVLVLFGASGSGKSMTLKMIAGIERPDTGRIHATDRVLFDSETGIWLAPQARRVGYVPQNYALFPHLSAHANITLPLRSGLRWSAARADARAREMLALVGLTERGTSQPHELSGGQQQRVALARALAIEPEVLLLDEPFAALDAPIRSELRQQFSDIQRQMRVPTIFVTHDLEEAVAVSRQLAVVVDGSVRQIGSARSILDRPVDVPVAELVQSRNILPGRVLHSPVGGVVQSILGDVPYSHPLLDDGTPVAVVVRPEALRITHEDNAVARPDEDLLFSGTLIDIVDHGTRAVASVGIAGTTLEISLSPSVARQLSLTLHANVQVALSRHDIHIIPLSTPHISKN